SIKTVRLESRRQARIERRTDWNRQGFMCLPPTGTAHGAQGCASGLYSIPSPKRRGKPSSPSPLVGEGRGEGEKRQSRRTGIVASYIASPLARGRLLQSPLPLGGEG